MSFRLSAMIVCCALSTTSGIAMAPSMPLISVEIDRFEQQWGSDDTQLHHWDGAISAAQHAHMLILSVDGTYDHHTKTTQDAVVELAYSHPLTKSLDWQFGMRAQVGHKPREQFAIVGISGDVPYGVEVEALTAISTQGTALLDLEAETSWLITQKLHLNPRLRLGLSSRADRRLEIGRGITSFGADLRVLYALSPEFQPYIGVTSDFSLGATRKITRRHGGDTSDTRAALGLRLFF